MERENRIGGILVKEADRDRDRERHRHKDRVRDRDRDRYRHRDREEERECTMYMCLVWYTWYAESGSPFVVKSGFRI